jgi:hypothetical protein
MVALAEGKLFSRGTCAVAPIATDSPRRTDRMVFIGSDGGFGGEIK